MTDEHAMKVAKVIAKAMGDNFSDAFKNKQRWTAKRGMSGGRFRDVNEPFQDDYIAAAQAAAAVIAADRAGLVAEIERLREALASIEEYWNRDQNETAMADACWNAVIAADRAGLVAEIERLREALASIEEYWNRDQNETAMADACWNAVNTADAALKDTSHD